jgi:hypothetical protein
MWNYKSYKKQILNKVVFWLPYEIQNHKNCTNWQNVKEAKDGLRNWLDVRNVSQFVHQQGLVWLWTFIHLNSMKKLTTEPLKKIILHI